MKKAERIFELADKICPTIWPDFLKGEVSVTTSPIGFLGYNNGLIALRRSQDGFDRIVNINGKICIKQRL